MQPEDTQYYPGKMRAAAAFVPAKNGRKDKFPDSALTTRDPGPVILNHPVKKSQNTSQCAS